jgi:hypothetical protein
LAAIKNCGDLDSSPYSNYAVLHVTVYQITTAVVYTSLNHVNSDDDHTSLNLYQITTVLHVTVLIKNTLYQLIHLFYLSPFNDALVL